MQAADGRRIHGFVFLPDRPFPPLIVSCHGGPSDGADPSFDPVVQVLVDHGYAVALVNYRGSTGYGATYRSALDGQWGIADVDDVCAFATRLAELGLVDGSSMAVRGGSAGGFTALRALERGVFSGAVSLYGVTDLERLAASCHDFEAHYLDRLIGPLPKARAIYEDRSPALHPERLRGAVLLLQGAEDPVVPPAQARSMHERLAAAGQECTLIEFAGEAHGFRQASTIEAALAAELAFYENLFDSGRDG